MAQAQYGPDNPHPFSTIRTELIWEGKYDEYGNRRNVDWRLIRGLFEAGLNPIRFAQGQVDRNQAYGGARCHFNKRLGPIIQKKNVCS